MAVDGTKVAGNVARAGMQDAEALAALKGQAAARSAELTAQLDAEGATAAPRLPPDVRQARALQDRVTAARKVVEAVDGPKQANPVDADARLLPTRQGWVAGYNAQAAVVATPPGVDHPRGRVIVAVDVVTAEHDAGQLLPVRDAAVATLRSAANLLRRAPTPSAGPVPWGTSRPSLAAMSTWLSASTTRATGVRPVA